MSPYRVDARFSGRHPFELFTLFLTVITSLPTVLGITAPPLSINAAMPAALVVGWSWVIFLGALLALAGIYWRYRPTGLLMEQVGMATTGAAALVYAGCILLVASGGPLPAGIVGGFGIACFWRWYQLQKVIDQAVAYDRMRKLEDNT